MVLEQRKMRFIHKFYLVGVMTVRIRKIKEPCYPSDTFGTLYDAVFCSRVPDQLD